MSLAGPREPTAEALEGVLAFLDPDRGRAGERYERIRGKLVRLFQWRGCGDPEELADETMERVGRKLVAGTRIHTDDPYRYFAGVAHRVFQETLRRQQRQRRVLEAARHVPPPAAASAEAERRMACLEHCLGGLGSDARDMVLEFYRGEKGERIAGRKRLAEGLGITVNALRIRAHRLRARLEACVRACLASAEDA